MIDITHFLSFLLGAVVVNGIWQIMESKAEVQELDCDLSWPVDPEAMRYIDDSIITFQQKHGKNPDVIKLRPDVYNALRKELDLLNISAEDLSDIYKYRGIPVQKERSQLEPVEFELKRGEKNE